MEGSRRSGVAVAQPAAGTTGAVLQALLQSALGAGFAILEPVVDIGIGDGAELGEVEGDVFDALLVGRAAVTLLEHPLKVLQLVRVGVPAGAWGGGFGTCRRFLTGAGHVALPRS